MEGLVLANDNESDDDDNQMCIDPKKCEETIQCSGRFRGSTPGARPPYGPKFL